MDTAAAVPVPSTEWVGQRPMPRPCCGRGVVVVPRAVSHGLGRCLHHRSARRVSWTRPPPSPYRPQRGRSHLSYFSKMAAELPCAVSHGHGCRRPRPAHRVGRAAAHAAPLSWAWRRRRSARRVSWTWPPSPSSIRASCPMDLAAVYAIVPRIVSHGHGRRPRHTAHSVGAQIFHSSSQGGMKKSSKGSVNSVELELDFRHENPSRH